MTDTHTAAADAGQGVAQPTPDAPREQTLKEILQEYEESSKAPEQPKKAAGAAPQSAGAGQPEPVRDDDELRSYVREKREQEARAQTDKAVQDAIGTLRDIDDSLSSLSDKMAEGLLYAEANRNPDFARAFMLREQSPRAWQVALKELGKSAAAELSSQPDPKLTANREAARASTRGVTQTKPAPDEDKKAFEEKVSKMSPAELEAFIRSNG